MQRRLRLRLQVVGRVRRQPHVHRARVAAVEQIQRKFRVRERTPQNAPRIRAGATKTDQKAELKKNQIRRRHPPKTSIFFLVPLITRQARDAKSPKWKRSDRRPAAQQDPRRRSVRRSGRGRGGNSRPKHRKSPPSGACSHHQRPRCANKQKTTTA